MKAKEESCYYCKEEFHPLESKYQIYGTFIKKGGYPKRKVVGHCCIFCEQNGEELNLKGEFYE